MLVVWISLQVRNFLLWKSKSKNYFLFASDASPLFCFCTGFSSHFKLLFCDVSTQFNSLVWNLMIIAELFDRLYFTSQRWKWREQGCMIPTAKNCKCIDWLIDQCRMVRLAWQSIDRLIDWLIDPCRMVWLAWQSIDWLMDWLSNCLIYSPFSLVPLLQGVDKLLSWLIWVRECLIGSSVDWLIDWFIMTVRSFITCLVDGLIDWMID